MVISPFQFMVEDIYFEIFLWLMKMAVLDRFTS